VLSTTRLVESECFIALTYQSYREFHEWIDLMPYTLTLNCRSIHIGTHKVFYSYLCDKLCTARSNSGHFDITDTATKNESHIGIVGVIQGNI
jgi:hypothetical protein